MCISATMLMAISTGVQVVGSLMQGSEKQESYDYRAQDQEAQAEQNRADAVAEREAGEVRADKIRKAAAREKSQARSALAKSGVVADAGSALTIQGEISSRGEEDALSEILTGNYRARRLEQSGATADREAALSRRAGENAWTSGVMGAGKSLLSGAFQYQRATKPGWTVQSGSEP